MTTRQTKYSCNKWWENNVIFKTHQPGLPTGYISWLHSDFGTFQDTGFTTPANVVNNPVGGWQDNSASANNLTQATSNKQPTFQEPINFNQPAVRFDGVNDCLQSTAGMPGILSSFTVFIACRQNVVAANGIFFAMSKTNGYNGSDDFLVIRQLSSHWAANTNHTTGQSPTISGGATDTLPHIFEVRWSASGNLEFWIDGTSAGTTPDAGGPLVLTGKMELGSIINGTAALSNTDIYELVIFPASISDASRTATRNSIQASYGIYPKVTTALFTSGLGYCSGGGLKLANGNLLAVIADSTADGTNDAKIYQSISTNQGVTWPTATLIISDATYGCNTYALMTQLANGRILLPWYKYDFATGVKGAFVNISTDNGQTFPALTTIVVPAGYNWVATSGRPIEVTPGGTIYLPCYALKTSSGRQNSILMQSTDGGITWTLKSVIFPDTATPDSYTEVAVAKTGVDSYLAFARREQGGGPYYTTSTDGGTTWAAPTQFNGVSFTGLAATPDLFYLQDGVLVFAFIDHSGGTILQLFRSINNGTSWGNAFAQTAVASTAGNPCLLEIIPKQIGLIHDLTDTAHCVFDTFGEAYLL